MRKNLLLALLILAVACFYSQTTTITLNTSKAVCLGTLSVISDYDAAIGYHDGANTAGNNYGTATQNAAYAIPSVAGPGLNVNRALIHFDLSAYPQNAVFSNAELDLFAFGPVGAWPGHAGAANNAYIERITGPWSENTVTWNNQPSTTTASQLFVTGTPNATQDYLNLNVTQIINDILLGQNNYGIMLRLVGEYPSNLLFFCSEDHPNPAKRPRLRVYYSVPAPTVAISGSSVVCSASNATLSANGANTYTWNNGSNNQNISVNPPGPTVYSVIGASGTCTTSATFTVKVIECVGIDEVVSTETVFSLYPNPANDYLSVYYGTCAFSEGSFALEDTQGRVIKSINLKDGTGTIELPLNGLSAGVYVCKLQVNSENVVTKKVIIVR
jgi:hypothetical protein